MEKLKILSIPITQCSYYDFLHQIFKLNESKSSSYVCFANVHMITECHFNNGFSQAVSNADLVAPDGKPLSVLLKWIYGVNQEKISGPDLFVDILKACEDRGKSVFFYGSKETVLASLKQHLQADYPSLNIRGMYSPPFRDLTSNEKQTIADKINALKPDFVFVALGCPKQEKWMAENKNLINACMLGVGQAFDIYAGQLKRAPVWIQNIGMEWLFRLLSEPRRLWKRYLYTNSIFIYLLLRKGITSVRYGKKLAHMM